MIVVNNNDFLVGFDSWAAPLPSVWLSRLVSCPFDFDCGVNSAPAMKPVAAAAPTVIHGWYFAVDRTSTTRLIDSFISCSVFAIAARASADCSARYCRSLVRCVACGRLFGDAMTEFGLLVSLKSFIFLDGSVS